MALIRIDSFGGLVPRQSKRSLPSSGAQVARNLMANAPEFRPLPADVAVTLAGLPEGPIKTLYRYPQDSQDAQVYASPLGLKVVKTQVKADTRERTYVSLEDGGAAPQVYYQDEAGTLSFRKLGVTYPTQPLGVVINSVAQFTDERRTQLENAAVEAVHQQILNMVEWRYAGGGVAVGAGRPGYLNGGTADGAYSLASLPASFQARVYRADPGEESAYNGIPVEVFSPWITSVIDSVAAEAYGTPAPVWNGSSEAGKHFARVGFEAKYSTYQFKADVSGPRAAILDLVAPGTETAETPVKLFTEAEWTAFEARLAQVLSPTANQTLATMVVGYQWRYQNLTGLLDGDLQAYSQERLYRFYDTAEARAVTDRAIDTFAEAVFQKLDLAYRAVVRTNPPALPSTDPATMNPAIFVLDPGGSGNGQAAGTKSLLATYIRSLMFAKPPWGFDIAGGEFTSASYHVLNELGAPVVASKTGPAVRGPQRLLEVLNANKVLLYRLASGDDLAKRSIRMAAAELDFTDEVWTLYRDTSPEAFMGMAGYPTAGSPQMHIADVNDIVFSVRQARDDLKTAIDLIAATYARIAEKLKPMLRDYMAEADIYAKFAEVDPVSSPTTRAYIYTLVNDWGEESAPYLPGQGNEDEEITLYELDQNDTATLTLPGLSLDPLEVVTKWRIYRSQQSAAGSDFHFVKELPITTTTFTDFKKDAELQERCASMDWLPPPSLTVGETTQFLRGLVNMPGGFMAGFVGKTVYFSEVFRPYAWPLKYSFSVDHEVVGLGVFGSTLLIATRGVPYFASGSAPYAMSRINIESNDACLSWRSIAPVSGGVVYAGQDGMCLASQAGVQVMSDGLFTRAEWQAGQPQETQCAEHDRVLYFTHGEPDEHGAKPVYAMDLDAGKLIALDIMATAIYADKPSNALYVARPPGASPRVVKLLYGETLRQAQWRSKRLTLEKEAGMAWLAVLGEQTADNPVLVNVWGYFTDPDTREEVEVLLLSEAATLTATASLDSIEPVRLQAERFKEYVVEVLGQARVLAVMLASSTEELRAI